MDPKAITVQNLLDAADASNADLLAQAKQLALDFAAKGDIDGLQTFVLTLQGIHNNVAVGVQQYNQLKSLTDVYGKKQDEAAQ
jgi:hypothetical protein